MMQIPSNLESRLSEFKLLRRADQNAIIRQLPDTVRSRFEAMLVEEKSALLDEVEHSSDAESEHSPWLFSCLTDNRRKAFPALRDNFTMTEHVRQSLEHALVPRPTNRLDQASGDGMADSNRENSPTLMSKMGDLLSRKGASL